MTKKFLTVFAIGVSAFFQAHAQLVITEVMTSEADGSHPDWWELTDFGANHVDLTGYSWNDDSHGGFAGADSAPFTGVIIHPGESIIFTEQSTAITSPDLFRSWWGISESVQVVMLGSTDPGLGAGGDTVRLWSTNAVSMGSATNGMDIDQAPDFLVDRVDTLPAPKGRSLICNTNNGLFGITNTAGLNGAFTAATTADVGSPGFASTNAGPIVIVSQPTNLLVNVGTPAVFQITAFGLPKPRFQWLFNGVPADPAVAQIVFTITNNYSRSTLTITNVQVVNAGTFRVVVTNGFQSVVSSNATLTVNTDPLAPVFTQTPSPTNLFAYLDQTISFTAGAFGNPPPGFQWQLNGTNIPGQTDAQYVFNLSATNQAGIYTVVATNSAGTNSASAVLVVTPKPLLFITEVMSSESTNTDTGDSSHDSDWWELSNFGDFPVNLKGYRFDDNNFSLAAAYTITNNVTIQPGESIILVEDMTPAQFRTWWGPQNLPPNLQIIEYPKIGFSAVTDAVTLWNAATTIGNESDYIDSVGFGTAIRGDSFGFDPTQLDDDGFGEFSVAGVNGAFVAAIGGDIGSPGTIVNIPNFTSFTKTGGGMALSWFTQPDWTNVVQFKNNLTDPNWTTLTNILGDNTGTVNFVDPTTNTQRFYRVILNLNQ